MATKNKNELIAFSISASFFTLSAIFAIVRDFTPETLETTRDWLGGGIWFFVFIAILTAFATIVRACEDSGLIEPSKPTPPPPFTSHQKPPAPIPDKSFFTHL